MNKNDFRLQKSMILESRAEIIVGIAIRTVGRLFMKLGISLHDLSNKLTTEGDAKYYEIKRQELVASEKESLMSLNEIIGVRTELQGLVDTGPVELVRADPAELLPPMGSTEDEVAGLEFLRTNGELMPKIVRENPYLSEEDKLLFDSDGTGDLFPKIKHGNLYRPEDDL